MIGANGTLGAPLVAQLKKTHRVHELSQDNSDYSESSLRDIGLKLKEDGQLEKIVCCIGTLHNDLLYPEKRLNQLNQESLSEYFRINTILPTLCIKAFAPLLDKSIDTQFGILSAMVGSISDNKLGGWYGYRSSKAALNMMVKTASIELARSHKRLALCAIHPGTTQGNLSKPFASRVDKSKYYTPQQSATRIIRVLNGLKPNDTGQFLNWDGKVIPW